MSKWMGTSSTGFWLAGLLLLASCGAVSAEVSTTAPVSTAVLASTTAPVPTTVLASTSAPVPTTVPAPEDTPGLVVDFPGLSGIEVMVTPLRDEYDPDLTQTFSDQTDRTEIEVEPDLYTVAIRYGNRPMGVGLADCLSGSCTIGVQFTRLIFLFDGMTDGEIRMSVTRSENGEGGAEVMSLSGVGYGDSYWIPAGEYDLVVSNGGEETRISGSMCPPGACVIGWPEDDGPERLGQDYDAGLISLDDLGLFIYLSFAYPQLTPSRYFIPDDYMEGMDIGTVAMMDFSALWDDYSRERRDLLEGYLRYEDQHPFGTSTVLPYTDLTSTVAVLDIINER